MITSFLSNELSINKLSFNHNSASSNLFSVSTAKEHFQIKKITDLGNNNYILSIDEVLQKKTKAFTNLYIIEVKSTENKSYKTIGETILLKPL